MNAATPASCIPENVSESDRAAVTAGLAKEGEAVNQQAGRRFYPPCSQLPRSIAEAARSGAQLILIDMAAIEKKIIIASVQVANSVLIPCRPTSSPETRPRCC